MRNSLKNEYNADLPFIPDRGVHIPERYETYRNLIDEANFSIYARSGRRGEEARQRPTTTFT